MATGTWNQGELEKRVEKIDLENYPTILFRDDSLSSDQIFDVIDFPNRLTAGKNLIKLRASNKILVKNSKIHIEILDSNGDPIYYEPLNYLEHDGTRVISIWVYPNKTAPGIGTVYIAGRTKIDLTNNQPIEVSQEFTSPNYINNPNVIWSRNISIAPENSKNDTEIIFTRPYPKATVREQVNKFFAPVNLTNVATDRNGSGTVTIKQIPSTTPVNTSTTKPNYEGGATPRTPMKSAGRQVSINPAITRSIDNKPLEVESAEIVTISTFSRLETTGFALSSSMEGGTITIVNPNVENIGPATAALPDGTIVPKSQISFNELGSALYNSGQLSGSYTFVIDKVLSSNKANVFQTSGFKNENENTFGAFSFQATRFAPLVGTVDYNITDISTTSNFTCSYIEPFILSDTEQSQSFAEIILSNIEPATGDVHKVQTLYKPSGQFGDFIDAGTVNIEQVELFEDVTSFENIQTLGTVYNRIGFFTDLSDFNQYWETTNGAITPEVTLTPAYKPELLLDGIELTPDSTFDSTSNRFGYLHLKSEYHPKLFANTKYIISFNATVEDIISTDSNIIYPRLDIYVSGSNSSIQPDSEYINQYKISNLDINDTLTGDLVNNGKLGTRVGTIELIPGQNFEEDPAFISFKALKKENADIYFVIRRGKWTVSNLSLKSDKQTGFSPNFTRINTRIPTEFLNTPLTFKFLYFDINNNKAQAETTVYPVTFVGDNLVIGGDDNLLSGSVFIGNTIGSGIELAGVNSGFIRSVGYEGFESASRTDKPGGFMMYTGSVLPNTPDNYNGVGIEIVQDSSSFLKFDTTDGLDIRTKKFFVGTEGTQFISGSDGNIEIKSANFHLTRNGNVTLAGTITANAGEIGGWAIGTDALTGGDMIIRKDGTIESVGFASDVAGSGFRLTANNGGYLEVENAKIRGTLATATFEKETVNAVGGQLYVANSTVLTGSGQLGATISPPGIHSTTDTTMSVENVSGFAQGEILTMKKISSTGFVTEYIYVNSASRNNNSSETNMSGKLFVTRGYGSGTTGNSSSIGDIASNAQSYSGSQVVVSTGKINTGYIRLNANPNDSATPYIDIVERTGSGLYDIELKARLGDLSGITDTINGTNVSGFGLYTDNAFLKGGIVATYGTIGGFTIGSNEITATDFTLNPSGKRLTLGSGNNIFIADGDEGIQLGHATFASAPFSVTKAGVLKSTSGTIGGFTIDGHSLTTTGVEINDDSQTLFISSSDFKVSHAGEMTASHATFEGVSSAESFEFKVVNIDSSNYTNYLSTYTKYQSIPGVGSRSRTFYELDLTGGSHKAANYVIIDPGLEIDYPIGRINPKNDGTEHGQFVYIETGWINDDDSSTGRKRKGFTVDGGGYDSNPSTEHERIRLRQDDRGVFAKAFAGYPNLDVVAFGTQLISNNGIHGFDETSGVPTGWTAGGNATISVESFGGIDALKLVNNTSGAGYAEETFTTSVNEAYAFNLLYAVDLDQDNDGENDFTETDYDLSVTILDSSNNVLETVDLYPIRKHDIVYKSIHGKFKATTTTSKIRFNQGLTNDRAIYFARMYIGLAYTDTYVPLDHKTMLFKRSAYSGWTMMAMDNTKDIEANFNNFAGSVQIENVGNDVLIDFTNDTKWQDNGARIIRYYSEDGDSTLEINNKGEGEIHINAGAFPTYDNGFASTVRLTAGYENDLVLQDSVFYPNLDLDMDLGKPNKRFKHAYIGPSSLYIGSGSDNNIVLSYNTGSGELELKASGSNAPFESIRVASANFGDSASFDGAGSVQIGQNAQGFIAVNALPGKFSTVFRAESSVLSGDMRMGSITQKSSGSFAILLDADDSQANRAKFVVESNSGVPGVGPRLFSVSESGETKAYGYLTVSQSVTADSFIGSLTNMTGTVDGGSF
jgi:hypothetical protein